MQNVDDLKLFKMLVPTSGPVPAQENAEYILKMAQSLRAEVLVIHIRDQGESREGDLALDAFRRVSENINFRVELRPAIGEVAQTIISTAQFEEVDLIVLGATKGRNVANWMIEKIINKTDIPVVIIPWQYEKTLYKETISDAPLRPITPQN